MLATRGGLVKKTALAEYDTNRTGGIIAINLREGDELIQALLVERGVSDVLLVSRKGMSVRFRADDDALRPMGRSTSGVIGMHFRGDDQLLAARVVTDEGFVFVVTEGGYAKRTAVDQYRLQQRGGLGIKVAKLQEARGDLAGSLIVDETDEVLVVLESGKVVRSAVSEVPAKGRDTMGVVFARFAEDDRIIAIARNSDSTLEAREPDDLGQDVQVAHRSTTSSASSVGEKLSLKSTRPSQPKQVRLKLVYIDFWSAVKFSFLISAAIGVVIFVAVVLIWTVLASTGVFDQISKLAGDVSGQKDFSINSVVSFAQVMGFTLVIAALNVVVGTVLGAIAVPALQPERARLRRHPRRFHQPVTDW